VIVASITPGALPVEIAASLGRRNFGTKGMVAGATAMALPGALVTVLMLTLLSTVQSEFLHIVDLVSVGVSVFIIYLLCSYITGMIRTCKAESDARGKKALALMLIVFFLVCEKNLYKLIGIDRTPIFSVSTIDILLVAFFCMFYSRWNFSVKHMVVMIGLGGIYLLSHGKSQLIENVFVVHLSECLMIVLSVWGVYQDIQAKNWKYEKNGEVIWKDLRVWLVILVALSIPALVFSREIIAFLGRGLLSAVMSFGGGDAYLTIADGLFVENGMVTEQQYYGQIVPVVNVLPGSILCKTLSGVGYYIGWNVSGSSMGGISFALAGFACSVAASCSFSILIYHLYNNLVSLTAIQMISRWIRPIIAGLLINIMVALCNQSITASAGFGWGKGTTLMGMLLLYLIDVILIKKCKIGTVGILLLNVAASFLMLL
jgi:chromate transporter